MTVKAKWHSQLPDVPEEDPFQARVEQLGLPIRLDRTHAQINERIAQTVQQEQGLFNLGIVCAIKDRDDTSCHACPLSAHEDPEAPLHLLCKLGREQEVLLTQLAVARETSRAGG